MNNVKSVEVEYYCDRIEFDIYIIYINSRNTGMSVCTENCVTTQCRLVFLLNVIREFIFTNIFRYNSSFHPDLGISFHSLYSFTIVDDHKQNSM